MSTNVSVSKKYQASADKVWAAIGKPGSISDWHPAITSSPSEGTSRTCTLADGGKIVESILSHDDAKREYKYSILSSPLPIEAYVSTIRVVANDKGCEVIWNSDFNVVGAPPAEIEAAIRGIYEAGLTNLVKTFGAAS